MGYKEFEVIKKIKISIISVGNELIKPGMLHEDISKSETELLMLRTLRNELLAESDWVVGNALEASLSNGSIPSEWKIYRQELRDITKKYSSISDKDFKQYATRKPISIKDIKISDNWARLKTLVMCVR